MKKPTQKVEITFFFLKRTKLGSCQLPRAVFQAACVYTRDRPSQLWNYWEKAPKSHLFCATCPLSCVFIPEACPEGLFGASCEELCDCGDNVSCHHVTGACDCPRGWRGRHCEKGEEHPWVREIQGNSGCSRAWEGGELHF